MQLDVSLCAWGALVAMLENGKRDRSLVVCVVNKLVAPLLSGKRQQLRQQMVPSLAPLIQSTLCSFVVVVAANGIY